MISQETSKKKKFNQNTCTKVFLGRMEPFLLLKRLGLENSVYRPEPFPDYSQSGPSPFPQW